MIIAGYEYGYDSGIGSFSKQSGNDANEVNGHFAYPAANGQLIDIKYTAGIDGYVPYTPNAQTSQSTRKITTSYGSANTNSGPITPSAEGYSYSYKTNHGSQPIHKESEGSYSYTNKYGTGSSSSAAISSNGHSYNVHTLHTKPATKTNTWAVKQYHSDDDVNSQQQSGDASYRFDYNTGDSRRQEAADAAGNIQGQYSYTNEDGQHDLQYIAGAGTGFVVTGGSLAIPNGIDGGATVRQLQGTSSTTTHTVNNQLNSSPNSDSLYTYSYNTGSSNRPAHSNTEFVNTSGWKTKKFDSPVVVYNVEDISSSNTGASWSDNSNSQVGGDASYQFAYNAGDSARQEAASEDGSVSGQYSFTNEAGEHSLQYHAGAGTGFVVTGGSLSVPNGIDGSATVRQSDVNAGWSTVQAHQHNSQDVHDSDAHFHSSGQVSAGSSGQTKLQYQVGGSALQRNGDSGQFSLTKLLPTVGNSKFGYVLEPK